MRCLALPAVQPAASLGRIGELFLIVSSLRESPLGLRRMHLPNIPELSLPVFEASVCHGG
jgi:hypothetical protein